MYVCLLRSSLHVRTLSWELDAVGVTSKDHLFNILFRRVGVKEFLWRKVAHVGAQFLIKSDILGNF